MRRLVIAVLAALAAVALAGGFNEARLALFVDWPPRFARPFPDIALVDSRGEALRMSDLAGEAALVHAVAMSSPASSALAGGDVLGGFGGVRPQAGLRSLEFLLARHGVAQPGDGGPTVLHLLLYDPGGGAPDAADAAAWATHFRLDGRPGIRVAAPAGDLRGRASAGMVPGVYLVDKESFVRYEAAGRAPRHDLFRDLLPAAAALAAR